MSTIEKFLTIAVIAFGVFAENMPADATTIREVVNSPLFIDAPRRTQDKFLKENEITWKQVKEMQKSDEVETKKNIHCTKSRPKVAFYMPGVPASKLEGRKETYWFSDVANHNSYQFNYDNIGKLFSNDNNIAEKYIDDVFEARCKITGAKITERSVYTNRNKTTILYVTNSNISGLNKISYHKYVVEWPIYYNWSVHSYEPKSKYSAEYLFKKYSNNIGIVNEHCR